MIEKPFSWCRDPLRIEGDYQQHMTSGLIALCEWLKAKNPCGVMCELGSAYGESAEIFSRYFKTVHCVDNWYVTPSSEESFDLRAAKAGNIVKHRKSTFLATIDFDDGALDFLYIDANHRYDEITKDIKYWHPKVRKNGFLGGHDYGAPPCPDVKRAVDEAFGKPLMTFEDFSWVVRV